jgi:hypothetical protein
VSKEHSSSQRIYPTHLSEALFFWEMRQESVIAAIREVCRQFVLTYERLPDLIFVNSALIKQFDKEIAAQPGIKQLCIESEDVIWFYSSAVAQRALPHAEYIVIAHTEMPGCSCSL